MVNKNNDRTPEEIKKGLECCTDVCDEGCDACVYDRPYNRRDKLCLVQLKVDALALIRQLEAERDQYKRERDAAVEKLRGKCSECINEYPGISHLADTECDNCVFNDSDYVQAEDHWQWRGAEVE